MGCRAVCRRLCTLRALLNARPLDARAATACGVRYAARHAGVVFRTRADIPLTQPFSRSTEIPPVSERSF